jgi:hypothetical protein
MAKILQVAWGIRVFFAFVALFLPLGHPHIWRQIDTLGVSLRYWLRWTVETDSHWLLLPAVLHSGEASGIMAMEWPLLNLLAAPLFAFGPAFGTIFARALVFALNLLLVLWNIKIWRHQKPLGIDASSSWRWMPLIGLGLVFFPKFIPDAIAMLLVLAASGYFYQKTRPVVATLLLSIGLLMKPTAVITLAVLWLAPQPLLLLASAAVPLLVSFSLTGFYYFKGTQWIQSLAGGESLYRLDPQDPKTALLEFFTSGSMIWDLVLQGLAFYGALPLLLSLMLLRLTRPLGRLWLWLFLQVICIAILDGEHSFRHQYYFLGTLPLICLLLQAAWEDLPRQGMLSWSRSLLLLLMVSSAGTYLAYEWRPLYIKAPAERFLSFDECARLKAQLPDWPWQKAEVFRTLPRPYPLVGLCFGERVGSESSPWGLFVDSDVLPSDCQVVAKSGHLVGARCKSPAL